jgi:hypothetical protein
MDIHPFTGTNSEDAARRTSSSTTKGKLIKKYRGTDCRYYNLAL